MKEFLFWVTIVTLIIFIMFALFLGILHIDKQIKKTEAMLLRVENQDKKLRPKIEPEPEKE